MADSTYNMFAVTGESSKTEPMKVTVQASGANLEMEVDTGAASTVISDATLSSSSCGQRVKAHHCTLQGRGCAPTQENR